MERLPLEVVGQIASCLHDLHEGGRIRPALATSSRSWQCVIEPLTFESLHITSNGDLETFHLAFESHTPRRRFLRGLRLDISLPRYSVEHSAKYETADDGAANDHFFSYQMSALLKELSRWLPGGKLNLVLGMHSPMHGIHRGQDKFDKDRYEVDLGKRQDIFSERYSYSYVRSAATCPAAVPCVTSFYVYSGGRCLDPGSMVALTLAFPNLERINWQYQCPAYFLLLRCQKLHAFASAVAGFQSPPKCQTLYSNTNSLSYPDKERLPNLVSGDSSLSDALRDIRSSGLMVFLKIPHLFASSMAFGVGISIGLSLHSAGALVQMLDSMMLWQIAVVYCV